MIAAVELALAAGALESGLVPRADLPTVMLAAEQVHRDKENIFGWRWRDDEVAFLEENLGRMSYSEIADKLGRTPLSVMLRRKRYGLPAPTTVSRREDELTATDAAYALGVDNKATSRWVREGILPGRELPLDATVRVVRYNDLVRFAVNPMNWPYFMACIRDTSRINDPRIRRLIELRKERWEDEWITSGQITAMVGNSVQHVHKILVANKKVQHAIKWSVWYFLKSEVSQIDWRFGKGSGTLLECYSPSSDCAMIIMNALGFSWGMIAHMMKWPKSRAANRMGYLDTTAVIAEHNLKVAVTPAGHLFADWRDFQGRFPGLERAVDRFLADKHLSVADRLFLQATIRTWAKAKLGPKHPVARSMESGWHIVRADTLYKRYEQMQALGVDPFGPVSLGGES